MRGFACLAVALCVTASAAFMCVPALRMFAESLSSAEEAALNAQHSNSTRLKIIDVSLPKPTNKTAAVGDEIKVYFGAGCFWHVQHEVIAAEIKHLGRTEREATSLTGYAGGSKTGPGGKVCYHNSAQDSDYGAMGHSEAVAVSIPPSRFPEFAKEFFALFVEGERADPQDVGGEYRSILGIPGGVQGPLFLIAKDAASQKGMTLMEGKGDDPDTLGKKLVYVYDSAKFPFYQAEVYHQYRDDMVWKYGRAYNALRSEQAKAGRVAPTGCPEQPRP